MQETIKPPVELRYQEELEALKKVDEEQGNKKPDNWQMSPKEIKVQRALSLPFPAHRLTLVHGFQPT